MNRDINPPRASDAPGAPPEIPEETVWASLTQVMDPEIGVNVVDLGLIYGIEIRGREVDVTMTVTTPGCPMEHSLALGVQTAVLTVPGVEEARVRVLHDPPWSPDRMSPAGREAAGIW